MRATSAGSCDAGASGGELGAGGGGALRLEEPGNLSTSITFDVTRHSSDELGFCVSPLAELKHAQLLSRWDQ
jgi:hypothetical protein